MKRKKPEPFPRNLLTMPPDQRIAYFRDYTVNHPALREASNELLAAIYNLGDANFVTVIGPTGVGKTTLVRWIEAQIVKRQSAVAVSPDHQPYVHVDPAPPTTGKFDWIDYYQTILDALHDPFVDAGRTGRATRDIRKATVTALKYRAPIAVITDEAQYIAKVASGRKLRDQLDNVKYLGAQSGAVQVLVGPYDMCAFRTANAQLGRRSRDIHFPRYDARNQQDLLAFKSVVWAFQRNLPLRVEPHLIDKEFEYLYARTIGCVGTLKDWLWRALARALLSDEKESKTLTHAHLKATAHPMDKVESALREALEGERDMREPPNADERLYTEVGLRPLEMTAPASVSSPVPEGQDVPKQRRRVGERSPQRDPIGESVG